MNSPLSRYELPWPREPFRGFRPFRLIDWRIFFERQADIDRLSNLVAMYRGTLVYGSQGCGKSSLLNAGLLPRALEEGHTPERIRVHPEPGRELSIERIPISERPLPGATGTSRAYLPSRFPPALGEDRLTLSCGEFVQRLLRPEPTLGTPLLIFDQFEELITLFDEAESDQARFRPAQEANAAIETMLRQLLVDAKCAVKIIFGFRDDYLARLTPLFSGFPHLLDHYVLLAPPVVKSAVHIVRGPFDVPQHPFDRELTLDVAQKITATVEQVWSSGRLHLTELQLFCLALWRQPELERKFMSAVEPGRQMTRIIESASLDTLRSLGLRDRRGAVACLSNLVTSEGTRDVVSEEKLAHQSRRNALYLLSRSQLKALLKRLPQETGLVRTYRAAGTRYYELSSEALISWITRWKRRHQARFAITTAIVGLWVFLIGVGLIVEGWTAGNRAAIAEHRAEEAEREARAAGESAEELLHFLQYDLLNDQLAQGQVVTLKTTDQIIDCIRDYYLKRRTDNDAAQSVGMAVAAYHSAMARANRGASVEALNQLRGVRVTLEVLHKASPDDKWLPQLAAAVDEYIGILLLDAPDSAAALEKFRASLAGCTGTDSQTRLRRAEVLANIGWGLQQQGDTALALATFGEARAILTKIITDETDDDELVTASTKSRGQISNSIARIHQVRGELQTAAAMLEAEEISRTALSREDPASTAARIARLEISAQLADLRIEQGQLEEARSRVEAGFAYNIEILKVDPEYVPWRITQMMWLQIRARVHWFEGRLDEASADLAIARDEYAKLRAGDPEYGWWQQLYADTAIRLAEATLAKGDVAAAQSLLREAEQLDATLVRKDPNNASLRSDLALVRASLAETLRKGDPVAALEQQRDALALREQLARLDSSNLEWQSELAASYGGLAKLARTRGSLPEAERLGRQHFEARARLARQDPANAQWQLAAGQAGRDLALVLLEQRKVTEAAPLLEQARLVADQLCQRCPTFYDAQVLRATIRGGLAGCEDCDAAEGRVRSITLLENAVTGLRALRSLRADDEAELREFAARLAMLRQITDGAARQQPLGREAGTAEVGAPDGILPAHRTIGSAAIMAGN